MEMCLKNLCRKGIRKQNITSSKRYTPLQENGDSMPYIIVLDDAFPL